MWGILGIGSGSGSVSAADVDLELLKRMDPHLMSEHPRMMIQSRPEERDWRSLQTHWEQMLLNSGAGYT